MGKYQYSPYQKYHAKRTEVDGIKFASKREAERYKELLLLQRAGEISGLKLQVKYELIPKQTDPVTGKAVRACNYIADFVYMENGKQITEDCKGMKTEVYKLKKKLMLYKYGIAIRES